jgi:hypothetical protein
MSQGFTKSFDSNLAIATQSEQEAASSTTTVVTPGTQKYHPSAAKAWVMLTTVTTTAINASYNVASLTDNGVGDTTVNFSVAFSSANYCVASMGRSTATYLVLVQAPTSATYNATSSAFRYMTVSTTAVAVDVNDQRLVFFGDQ